MKLCTVTTLKVFFKKLGVFAYNPNDWRLFIDNYKRSLKCVPLKNGNTFGSITLAYSTTLKEKYSEIKFVLEKIHTTNTTGSFVLI